MRQSCPYLYAGQKQVHRIIISMSHASKQKSITSSVKLQGRAHRSEESSQVPQKLSPCFGGIRKWPREDRSGELDEVLQKLSPCFPLKIGKRKWPRVRQIWGVRLGSADILAMFQRDKEVAQRQGKEEGSKKKHWHRTPGLGKQKRKQEDSLYVEATGSLRTAEKKMNG